MLGYDACPVSPGFLPPSPHGKDPDYIHFSTEVYEERIAVVSSAIDRALDRAGGGHDRSDATAS